jgi:glycosyltransferase involved in cell wall biosynthesis
MELVFSDVARFDVMHFHTDYVHFPFLRRYPSPSVTTLHGFLNPADCLPFFSTYPESPLVSISDAQRIPLAGANWLGTVHHGLPLNLHKIHPRPGSYLAFLGRLSPEKRLDRAIAIARRTGLSLKIAGKIYPEEKGYYDEVIQPLLRDAGSSVEMVGEIDVRTKDKFLGGALALLFPIDWEEPFGLVMIEAMACGTPVIAWPRGAVPEVIEEGVTGFVVNDIDAAVRAVGRAKELDRPAIRRVFEERFDAMRMARQYVELYGRAIERHRTKRQPDLSGGGI